MWKSPLELTREDFEEDWKTLDLEDDDGLDVLYDWLDVFYEDVLAVAEYELWSIAERAKAVPCPECGECEECLDECEYEW